MEFKDVMQQRRAVNFFDPTQDVTDEQLRQIIETAARAPSGFNLQPWRVLRDKEKKETLKKDCHESAENYGSTGCLDCSGRP